MNITEDYVSFEVAKLLKEKGFHNPSTEQKSSWSEEDKRIMSAILQLLKDCESENGWNCVYSNDREVFFVDIEKWLQSLKERAVWKPSEEQLYWLKYAANSTSDTEKRSEVRAVFNELYKQFNMAHFIRIPLLKDLGEVKINLDKISTVRLYKDKEGKKTIDITFTNGNTKFFKEGYSILDAEKLFDKFPS